MSIISETRGLKFPKGDDEIVYVGMVMSNLSATLECKTNFERDSEIPRKLGLMSNWITDKLMLAEHSPFQSVKIERSGQTLRCILTLGRMANDK